MHSLSNSVHPHSAFCIPHLTFHISQSQIQWSFLLDFNSWLFLLFLHDHYNLRSNFLLLLHSCWSFQVKCWVYVNSMESQIYSITEQWALSIEQCEPIDVNCIDATTIHRSRMNQYQLPLWIHTQPNISIINVFCWCTNHFVNYVRLHLRNSVILVQI